MENKGDRGSSIVSDMVASRDPRAVPQADLVVEPDKTPEADSFTVELEKTLKETESAVLRISEAADALQAQSWHKARGIVESFKPVPWFIWRLSNFVLGNPGPARKATEGLVFGLRRLLFAAASDPLLGTGNKVNGVHQALEVLKPDVLAAVAVIHAICRRLSSQQHERIWRPILDDAMVRAQIGFYVGAENPYFGSGRGMLAGFAGRCGLAILIASGDLEQARRALELLATGAEIKQVGLQIYGCDPLQISAMTLSASGCGRDAAFGTVAYSTLGKTRESTPNATQVGWQAAFTVAECVRTNRLDDISEELWQSLNFCDETQRTELQAKAKQILRRGHGWHWLAGTV
ncbi:MAG: hypothetical protein K1X79_14180 [Oligoflexia bacterium]|nr:hypothetical protein [Oligoflexia bacterium]